MKLLAIPIRDMPTPPVTTPDPLFADSPAERFRGNWRFASGGTAPEDPELLRKQSRRSTRWHWIFLVLIILLGAIARFIYLDQPALWGDEAATYYRASGTYDELMMELRQTRFMPLHYMLLWFIGQKLPLDVWVLRLVPAITGTLMVPAMYWLTRMLAGRRVALITALFTACSAWMIIYSRDAKMYMPMTFLVTMCMACFVSWMKSRGHSLIRGISSWIGMVIFGAAAGGFHAPGLIPVVMFPLYYLLSRRVHWRSGLALAIGLLLIASLPGLYYLSTPRTINALSEPRQWRYMGISWVEDRNEGHTDAELVADTAASFTFGWQFIQERGPFRPSPDVLDRTAAGTLSILGLFIVIGLLPWPRHWRGDPENSPSPALSPTAGESIPATDSQSTLNPSTQRIALPQGQAPRFALAESQSNPAGSTSPSTASPKRTSPGTHTSGRSLFWLLGWLILPAVACYCLSTPSRPLILSPADWSDSIRQILNADSASQVFQALPKLLALPVTGLTSLSVAQFMVIPIAVIMAAILMIHRWIARGLTVLLGLAILGAAAWSAWQANWVQPIAALDQFFTLLNKPWVLPAGIALLLALIWHTSGPTLRQRSRTFTRGLLIGLGIYAGCIALSLAIRKPMPSSVWMPRYMASLWPAFAVLICWAMMRLPTWPVRTLAIAILLSANIAQSSGRIFAGSEPPLDQVAQDVIEAQSAANHLLVYTPDHGAVQGPPGTGAFMGYVGRYYLFHYGKQQVRPEDFGYTSIERLFMLRFWRVPGNLDQIARDIRQRSDVSRIVVWQRFEVDYLETSKPDFAAMASQLGDNWHLKSVNVHPVRCFWQWAPMYDYVRVEFQRSEPTQESSASARP